MLVSLQMFAKQQSLPKHFTTASSVRTFQFLLIRSSQTCLQQEYQQRVIKLSNVFEAPSVAFVQHSIPLKTRYLSFLGSHLD